MYAAHFAAGLAIAGCARPQVMRPAPTVLDATHEPLRARFDRDAGAARVLVLASPT